MAIYSVLTLTIIALIQGRHAKIGVVKTVYVPEVYVIVILDTRVKIVLKHFVHQVNIINLRVTHAEILVQLKLIRINIQKLVYHVQINVRTA